MFDDIKQALRDLLHGNVPPEGRRELLHHMKETLVRARLGLDDLKGSIEATRRRLQEERAQLDTVRRRKGLAHGIGDTETVTVAGRFEMQHAERVAVLERKLEVQESEFALVEREVTEMTEQFKAAAAGVGSGMRAGAVGESSDEVLDDARSSLERELDGIDRAQRKAATQAEAEARLADLKRRMGK